MKISPITLESNLGVFGKDVKTPYDLEILLLGICPREMLYTCGRRQYCDNSKRLSRMSKLWYIYELDAAQSTDEWTARRWRRRELYSALLELVALSCLWNFPSTVASALRKPLTVTRKFLTLHLYHLKNVHCFRSVTMDIMPHKDCYTLGQY